MNMLVTFDYAKDRLNRRKHGMSLGEAAFIDWDSIVGWEDMREDYGETRLCALGTIDDRIYFVVYVERQRYRRIISLRKASKKEAKYYARQSYST
jgi:uncharacterized DUF497 family protein